MKILIIEDDRNLAQNLRQTFDDDFTIDLAYSGHHGLICAFANPYSLIIIDLQLPDVNGYQVCRELRDAELTMPILILSGLGGPQNKAELLNAGADDYVTKPFDLEEFEARIRALLRRSRRKLESEVITIDKLKLDSKTHDVYYGEHLLQLSKKEYLLLYCLMQNKNMPLSRFQLFDHVWESEQYLDSNTVDVHICHLRKKLGPNGAKLIQTAYGRGYVLSTKNIN